MIATLSPDMRALILEQGSDRAALTAARALRDDGWTVGVGTPLTHGLPHHSRAVANYHVIPPISAGAEALVDAANQAIAECGYEVVFSCDDAGVIGLSTERDRLNAIFPYADHTAVAAAFDKLELMRNAESVGLPVPRTEVAEESAIARFGEAPLVVKPRHTFLENADVHVEPRLVTGWVEAEVAVEELQSIGAEPIIQARLSGRLMAFTAVTDRDSRIVARAQQVADRTWPPMAGISAYAHTVTIDEDLQAGVARLLESLHWFGAANLQFMLCDDGHPRLLDFNGRFYGSLALAVGAGANLPAAWARLATTRPLCASLEARPGTRYQWLARDLRASTRGKTGLGRLGAALTTTARAFGAKHAAWSASDPFPSVANYGRKLLSWMR